MSRQGVPRRGALLATERTIKIPPAIVPVPGTNLFALINPGPRVLLLLIVSLALAAVVMALDDFFPHLKKTDDATWSSRFVWPAHALTRAVWRDQLWH